MRNSKSIFIPKFLIALMALGLWTMHLAPTADAQGTISAGTTIHVRTTEEITADDDDGRVFTAVVDQNVSNRRGRVAIPRGSDVELVVREISDDEVALDLNAIIINGLRYGVAADAHVLESERREGIGANKRTGKYVGGGAVIGAIIGGITGGTKGAAIGAGAGAAAGAATQVLTRGESIEVPAETLLTFRLAEPLVASSNINGSSISRQKPGQPSGHYSLTIGRDNYVSWTAPAGAQIYVQVDNQPRKLFASGQSGNQSATWMTRGHLYTFILLDGSGNEVERQHLDLR